MLKAFPEDRVQVCVRPTKDNKTIADIEKLLESPLEEFTGRCVRKGKAFFVEPDLPHLSRWLFIPPHARNGVKEGDYVRSAVLRHPIRDGKPQAKVLAVLGDETTPSVKIFTASPNISYLSNGATTVLRNWKNYSQNVARWRQNAAGI